MEAWDLLPVAYGAVVGIALGLTGGGGSILAVPLLVYGLGSGIRESVGISLAAVGATAIFGAASRWRSGQLEIRTGLLFAAAGMVGAPVGTRIGAGLPPAVTMVVFAVIMLVVALRMGFGKGAAEEAGAGGAACRRGSGGDLRWTSRCAVVLAAVGFFTGVLSGIFGVGGGFVIVPALIMTTGMGIHRAVGTSLMAIALICASGVASYLVAGDPLPARLTALFVAGGIAGMGVGNILASRLSGPVLSRIFAAAIGAVAAAVLAKNLV